MNTTTGQRRGMVQRLHWVKRWMYRTGRPGALARAANRISAAQFSAGILSPARAVTLEVPGRRTGRLVSFPVVVADYQGGRYVVSMLGNDANWVRNVRAAGGLAALRRGTREQVQLEEVEPGDRAPILRPHLPVDPDAPLEEFERIADQFPVFRIIPAAPGAHRGAGPATRPGVRGALELSAHMTVRPGQLDGFKKQAAECIRLTRQKDTATLRYDWFLTSDAARCEVREAYTGAQGLIEHRANVAPALQTLFEHYADNHTMTIYGQPSRQLPGLAEAHHMTGHITWFSFLEGLEPAARPRPRPAARRQQTPARDLPNKAP
jgi:quinol monooxygenase YgiN